MPPSRVRVQSDITASQNAPRRSRATHEEHPDNETQEDYTDVHVESEAGEAGSSQGTEVQSMIISSLSSGRLILQQQRQRHNINKQKVKDSYDGTKVALQNDIANLFDSHEDQADAAHSAQLNRLADLIATKATIEAQMTAKLAHLRSLYDAHSRELTSVLGSRIKELK